MVSEQFDPTMGARSASVQEDQQSIQKSLEKLKQEIAKISKRLDLLPDRRGKRSKIQGDDEVETSDPNSDLYLKLKPKSDSYLVPKVGSNFESESSNFPSFNGNNSGEWILNAEKYFALKCLNNEQRLQISASSFEGVALRWFRWENQRRPFRRWEDMKSVILRQFPSEPRRFHISDPNPIPVPNPDPKPIPVLNTYMYLNLSPNSDSELNSKSDLKFNSKSDPNCESGKVTDEESIGGEHSVVEGDDERKVEKRREITGSDQFLKMNPELDLNHESGMAVDGQEIEGENSDDEDNDEKKIEGRSDQILRRAPSLLSISEPPLPSQLPIAPPQLQYPSSSLPTWASQPWPMLWSNSVEKLSSYSGSGYQFRSVGDSDLESLESNLVRPSRPKASVILIWPKISPDPLLLIWPKHDQTRSTTLLLNLTFESPLPSINRRNWLTDFYMRFLPPTTYISSFKSSSSIPRLSLTTKEIETVGEPPLWTLSFPLLSVYQLFYIKVKAFFDCSFVGNKRLVTLEIWKTSAKQIVGTPGISVEVVQGGQVSLNFIVGLSIQERLKLEGLEGQKIVVLIDSKKSIGRINERKTLENGLEQQLSRFFGRIGIFTVWLKGKSKVGQHWKLIEINWVLQIDINKELRIWRSMDLCSGKNAVAGVGDPDSQSSMEMVLCRSITLAKARRVSDSKLLKRQVRWRWGKALTRKRWMENAHQDPPPPPLPPPQLDVFEIKNLHRLFHFLPP